MKYQHNTSNSSSNNNNKAHARTGRISIVSNAERRPATQELDVEIWQYGNIYKGSRGHMTVPTQTNYSFQTDQ